MEAFVTRFNIRLQSDPTCMHEGNVIFYFVPEIAVFFNVFLKLQMSIYKLT